MREDEIEVIIRMKKMMTNRSLYDSSEKYMEIYHQLESLCMCYCNHVWVKDAIDIDVERSYPITYCELCECVLS